MRPLRIVMATGLYLPRIGGIERHVQSLAHELSRRSHHVSVVTLRRKDTPPYSDDGGLRASTGLTGGRVLLTASTGTSDAGSTRLLRIRRSPRGSRRSFARSAPN